MKNFKVVVATLLIAALGITVSSFTVKNYNSRAFADQCYKVNSGVSISVAIINNPSDVNFATELAKLIPGNFTLKNGFNAAIDCPQTTKVCAICFDPGNTGKTLADVLAELRARLSAGTFTFGDGATFNMPAPDNFLVTVYEFNG